jgi:archaellum component FlaC
MEKEHLEILLEDIRGKFDLVLEGHDTLRKEIRDTREELGEKINLVDFKVETLNRKIDGVEESLNRKIDGVRDELGQKLDAVAGDLAAHRADTEIHQAHYEISEKKD